MSLKKIIKKVDEMRQKGTLHKAGVKAESIDTGFGVINFVRHEIPEVPQSLKLEDGDIVLSESGAITEDELLKFTKKIFSGNKALVVKRTIWVGVSFLKGIYKKSGKEGLSEFLENVNAITDERGLKFINKIIK